MLPDPGIRVLRGCRLESFRISRRLILFPGEKDWLLPGKVRPARRVVLTTRCGNKEKMASLWFLRPNFCRDFRKGTGWSFYGWHWVRSAANRSPAPRKRGLPPRTGVPQTEAD
ncbi:hypothetical protein B4135_0880 [Caldibacillus debilis]|uniref:Uncharacterized protein n=1 Tax=Caldibacillus debilis TaxID=301148 RepID=A0A150M6J5_9BACI|nr:hypothetical protein B4135_0880 [Caldibacillus debilis]